MEEAIQITRTEYEELLSLKHSYTALHTTYTTLKTENEALQEKQAHLEETYQRTQQQLEKYKAEYSYLQQQYKTLQRLVFGPKREKVKEDDGQLQLFNEAEAIVDRDEGKKVAVRSYRRKKGGKKRLPDTLPIEEVEYDVDEEDKLCPCCGKMRPCIGQEVTEELDILPARVQKRVIKRKKYGPCRCDSFLEEGHREVLTAPQPKRLLPGSQVSERSIAYVIVSKYCDGIPLYRQEEILQRYGIDITRATISHWVLQVAAQCQRLYELMIQEAKRGPLIQMDETHLQVLHQEGRSPTSKSYMWVMIGYPKKDVPVIVYTYAQGRSKDVPMKLLEGYDGYVQSDGYSAYDAAVGMYKDRLIGCFAHARRKFYEAHQVTPTSITKTVLQYIDHLFAIERYVREKGYDDETFVMIRKKMVQPVLDEIHRYCQAHIQTVLPRSKTGEALSYCLLQWDKLVRYTEHPWCRPDNNAVERAIRNFVVGRKNWLFANTKRGATASAIMYSLVQTAKANNKEPYQYLCNLFSRLPYATNDEALYQLLPHTITL